MDKLKIVKKAKGIVRINKVGMSPLVIKEKESVWPVSVLGPYNKELLMFQKMGVIDLVSIEEGDKKGSTREGIEEGKEEVSQELETEVSEAKEEQSESEESENKTEENKKLSRRKKKVN